MYKKNLRRFSFNKNRQKLELNSSKSLILIYNNIKKNFFISKKESSFLLIISFIYFLYFEILKLLYYLGFYPVEFWTFDIIFMLTFMHLYFPHSTYKHQKYSMLFVAIVNSILLIIASNNKIYNEFNKNIYELKGKSICAFAIIAYMNITFLAFFARINGKLLMDNQFISPYKIIILIGIIGLFFDSIISIISSLINVKRKCINNDNNNYNNNIYCYLDTSKYLDFSNSWKVFKELFFTIIYIICCFLSLLSEFLIIKYLNPNYILMSDAIYFEFIKIKDFLKKK